MSSDTQSPRPHSFPWRRVARVTAVAVLAVLLLPYLIVPFYRFVNPVSTLMLWRWATGARVVRANVSLDPNPP